MSLPGERAVDDRLLNRVVAEVTRLHLARGLTYHLALGQLLLDRFFDGDLAAYAGRRRAHASYRALAARKDLPVSHVTLWNALAVLYQFRSLPPETARSLSMSHHKALLPLRHDDERRVLAVRANDEGWSYRELQRAVRVARARRRKGEKRGRPVLPAFQKTLRLFARLLDANGEQAFGGLDHVDDLDEQTAAQLYRTAASMSAQCDRVCDALVHRVPGAADGDSVSGTAAAPTRE